MGIDKRVTEMFFEVCGHFCIFGFGYFACKIFSTEIPLDDTELITFVATMIATICHFMKRLGKIFPEKKGG